MIQPDEVEAFLLPLPVGLLPGVGKVNEERLSWWIGAGGCERNGDATPIIKSVHLDCGSYASVVEEH